jgi:hypothetical protein
MRLSLIKKSLPTSLYKREGRKRILDAAILTKYSDEFHP